jgi:DNA polymerase
MVFGEGNPDAIVMFIGEGPGKEEGLTGRPFVGRSGTLLRDMIKAIGIPEEHHYIANVVKDRPPGNRPPESEEIEACSKFLKKQIEIIVPRLLVLLGRTAVKAIIPEHAKTRIDNLRSMKGGLTYFVESPLLNVPVIVTYHPSALLRTPWRKVGAKEDFLFIQEVYKSLIP